MGFNGSWSGANGVPTTFTLNGTACGEDTAEPSEEPTDPSGEPSEPWEEPTDPAQSAKEGVAAIHQVCARSRHSGRQRSSTSRCCPDECFSAAPRPSKLPS